MTYLIQKRQEAIATAASRAIDRALDVDPLDTDEFRAAIGVEQEQSRFAALSPGQYTPRT